MIYDASLTYLLSVDQHACDEKYRYETLQKCTTINTQPLVSLSIRITASVKGWCEVTFSLQVVPRKMELEPADEMVVSESLDVFKASGFELVVDEEANPGVSVTHATVHKRWHASACHIYSGM